MESRRIHQKQTPQQTVPARVIQKARLFLSITNHTAGLRNAGTKKNLRSVLCRGNEMGNLGLRRQAERDAALEKDKVRRVCIRKRCRRCALPAQSKIFRLRSVTFQ